MKISKTTQKLLDKSNMTLTEYRKARKERKKAAQIIKRKKHTIAKAARAGKSKAPKSKNKDNDKSKG